MNEEKLYLLPLLLTKNVEAPAADEGVVTWFFFFDCTDDSLYAATPGEEEALYFPSSGGCVYTHDLNTDTRVQLGVLKHNSPSDGLVTFIPEEPCKFNWTGEINNRSPIKMNPYLQAEVDLTLAMAKEMYS